MHTPLFDHSFKTIGYMTEQSKQFIPTVLESIEVLKVKIAERYDPEVAESVIGDGISHALRRCLEYFQPATNIDDLDYEINYSYASNAAIAIDQVIANELPEL